MTTMLALLALVLLCFWLLQRKPKANRQVKPSVVGEAGPEPFVPLSMGTVKAVPLIDFLRRRLDDERPVNYFRDVHPSGDEVFAAIESGAADQQMPFEESYDGEKLDLSNPFRAPRFD